MTGGYGASMPPAVWPSGYTCSPRRRGDCYCSSLGVAASDVVPLEGH